MLDTEVMALLSERAPEWAFRVQGEGRNFQITAVSAEFEGMSRVKRQQAVYRLIADEIGSGVLHAITITARTPTEDDAQRDLGL